MRKSTKIITTAIALVLIVGFMIVGIYAATQASASIGATVSWTAETGIGFDFKCGIMGTEADYKSSGATSWEEYLASFSENGESFIEFDDYEMSVRTNTSNNSANGSTTLNATFYDPTDDGVNNPTSIIYGYYMANKCTKVNYNWDYDNYDLSVTGQKISVVAELTKYPVSNDYVDVKYVEDCSIYYFWEYGMWYKLMYQGINDILKEEGSATPRGSYEFESTTGQEFGESGEEAWVIYVVLTLKDPNQSLASFDAGVTFSFTRGNVVNLG